MYCEYFEAGVCQSCPYIRQPNAHTFAQKTAQTAELLARTQDPAQPIDWLEPAISDDAHFRNKAKLAVGGSVEHPTLGILDKNFQGVDLSRCLLYDPAISAAIEPLHEFVTIARLTPFDVPTNSGELKTIVIESSPSAQLMIRFVLRSTESVVRIRKHLPWLTEQIPTALVVTANILPERKAVIDGEKEIVLTNADALPLTMGGMTLYARPQSFIQTNTAIAEQLYTQARSWIDRIAARSDHSRNASTPEKRPLTVWDLYCGVGGFGLFSAGHNRHVLGIEISNDAVESANQSAREAQLDAHFIVGDALGTLQRVARKRGTTGQEFDSFAARPDVVIVDPPRRGIGDLAPWLDEAAPAWIIYSSCNPESLARDLAQMPHYTPREARAFDMFPHTKHQEVALLLARTD
ncbi:MAG: methyltransferase domain-containing protein [Actinomycetaceae bacterium]|nr:methyltransferase domain-containing protein [Actinomycetaceae bacterium]MDY6082635.1 methyltransferase domain-containing protein [Actinomycetaceae bacterium]